jgi:benzodiazapine receptor
MNHKNQKWLNLFMFLAVLLVNYLASIGKINRLTPGKISDSIRVLITPAAYVFSIWGLIYLLLLVFVIYQFLPKFENSLPVKTISYWFSLTCLLNIAWIFSWHYKQFALSLVIMVAFLITLMVIMNKLYKISPMLSVLEKRVFKLPFSVYFGWISVATIANTSFVLVFTNWKRFNIGPDYWSVIILFVIMLLGITVLTLKKDQAFVWVFVWALIGIAYKTSKESPLTSYTALIMIAFLSRNLLASYLQLLMKPVENEIPTKKQHPKKK